MTKAHSIRIIATLATTLLLASGAFAAGIAGGGASATWNLTAASNGSSLKISGPDGFEWHKDFGAGESPSFSVFDKAGFEVGDGRYYWSLTLTPSIDKATMSEMAKARAAGDSIAIAQFESSLGERKFYGSFLVDGGTIKLPSELVENLQKDILHQDDVIIFFSLCVGNDCVNGESFGFDTMRLKENNLRIHFDDTSNSASFPANDWRITINDSTNGGGSYFSIDDATAGRQVVRVDAGAPANSLRIDSAGDVGIGESNPVVELHVQDGDSPTLRLEQDGSSGFTPQTFDIVSNEANFFIRDVTNGSQLPFRIKPGVDTDSLFIDADNDIGIGTNSPANDAAVEIRRSDAAITLLQITNNNASAQNTGVRIVNNDATWDFRGNTSGQFQISLVGGGAAMVIDDADRNVTFSAYSGGGSTLVCLDNTGKLVRASGTNCP